MARSGRRLVAPGSVAPRVEATGAGELSLIEIARGLEAAAERLVALGPYTAQAEPQAQELRTMRMLIESRLAHGPAGAMRARR